MTDIITMVGGLEIVRRLGWALLHSLWLGAAVAAAMGASMALLRRRSAQTRYVAGCIALVLLAAAAVGALALAPAQPPQTGPEVAPAVAAKGHARLLRDHSNPRERQTVRDPGDRAQPSLVPGRHREHQLVILAARKRFGNRIDPAPFEPLPRVALDWQRVRIDLHPHPAGKSQLGESVGQPVTQVHACAGRAQPGKRLAQPHPRLGMAETPDQAFGLQGSRLQPRLALLEAGPRRPDRAAEHDRVVRASARSGQQFAGLDGADGRDVDDQWPR